MNQLSNLFQAPAFLPCAKCQGSATVHSILHEEAITLALYVCDSGHWTILAEAPDAHPITVTDKISGSTRIGLLLCQEVAKIATPPGYVKKVN